MDVGILQKQKYEKSGKAEIEEAYAAYYVDSTRIEALKEGQEQK